jgi:hypothetical protein
MTRLAGVYQKGGSWAAKNCEKHRSEDRHYKGQSKELLPASPGQAEGGLYIRKRKGLASIDR